MPKCRCCGKEIDKADTGSWVLHARNWYYHTVCYENWIKKKDDPFAQGEADEWRDLLWDYLTRDVKMPGANYMKFKTQWESLLKKNKVTPKGLFFACRYFYEVKKGDPKEANGGIGIIPYIYQDSCAYWQDRVNANAVICAQIEKQMAEREIRTVVRAQPQRRKKDKPQTSLSEIMEMEDDE